MGLNQGIIKDYFKKVVDMKETSNHYGSTTIACSNDSEMHRVIFVIITRKSTNECVLDSGCTFHMFYERMVH